jgi:hypothetical protein
MNYYYHGTSLCNWNRIKTEGLKQGFLAADELLAAMHAGIDGVILQVPRYIAKSMCKDRGLHIFYNDEFQRLVTNVLEVQNSIPPENLELLQPVAI